MKSSFKIFGIVAAVAIIGLSMVACGDTIIHVPDPGPGPGTVPDPGDDERLTPLTLSGQVWTWDWGTENSARFNGNRVVFSDIGGSGAITDGQLNFSIGTPSRLESILNIFDEFHARFYDFNISDPSARTAYLDLLTSVSGTFGELHRIYGEYEVVAYLFVDRDVTVTGRSRTFDGITTRNINLNLGAGWNAFYRRIEDLRIADDGVDKVSLWSYAFSISDPAHMRWYLLDFSDLFAHPEAIEPASSRALPADRAGLRASLLRARQ